ncbi:MAG: hypothetical protein WCT20_00175 [Candidatus Babeliales bacterium]
MKKKLLPLLFIAIFSHSTTLQPISEGTAGAGAGAIALVVAGSVAFVNSNNPQKACLLGGAVGLATGLVSYLFMSGYTPEAKEAFCNESERVLGDIAKDPIYNMCSLPHDDVTTLLSAHFGPSCPLASYYNFIDGKIRTLSSMAQTLYNIPNDLENDETYAHIISKAKRLCPATLKQIKRLESLREYVVSLPGFIEHFEHYIYSTYSLTDVENDRILSGCNSATISWLSQPFFGRTTLLHLESLSRLTRGAMRTVQAFTKTLTQQKHATLITRCNLLESRIILLDEKVNNTISSTLNKRRILQLIKPTVEIVQTTSSLISNMLQQNQSKRTNHVEPKISSETQPGHPSLVETPSTPSNAPQQNQPTQEPSVIDPKISKETQPGYPLIVATPSAPLAEFEQEPGTPYQPGNPFNPTPSAPSAPPMELEREEPGTPTPCQPSAPFYNREDEPGFESGASASAQQSLCAQQCAIG